MESQLFIYKMESVMKFKYALTSLALSVAILSSVPSTAFAIGGAIGGASGAKVDYQ
ncbi:hypothetical protein K6350_003464, partial [Salmonella enterica]|nr:hypothetical protein [Salmonella enterica]